MEFMANGRKQTGRTAAITVTVALALATSDRASATGFFINPQSHQVDPDLGARIARGVGLVREPAA